ncbi:hypothetical protein IKQ19_03695, partial [Candidatus Saccharibacteria bacterium]|nr:hypothetical protein [Candidatus Saccharibacteria bacterium]
MKKLCFAIFTISAICFAFPPELPTAKCNPDPNPNSNNVFGALPGANFDKSLRDSTCYDYGYVCKV